MVEIFLLSLIQGITEFLPISSSSHLIIFSNYTNFKDQSLTLDVSLHIGSFFAVLTYFHRDIVDFVKNKYLFLKVLTASLPVMIFGFILIQTNFIEKLRSVEIIGWTTFIFGILLYVSDKFKLKNNVKKNFSFKAAIIIGLFQTLSLIPGVSRSGISITAARILKFKRYDAAKIAFLLSIPTLGAITIFGLKNIINSGNLNISIYSLTSIFLSFLFSLITINYFLKFIKNFSLIVFVIYRIFLGSALLLIAYL
jgi:undecaprenyl-diphosphatase